MSQRENDNFFEWKKFQKVTFIEKFNNIIFRINGYVIFTQCFMYVQEF